MNEQMKKIGRQMGIRMGILMSFCLALTGTISSGHFTPVGFLFSFIVSAIISIFIGFLVPVGKITGDVCRRAGFAQGTIKERLLSSLISNLIYTPLITFVMVLLAYTMAMKQSGGMAQLSFIPMFLHSLVICFIVGYVLIFIFQPLFLKQLMKKYN
ncbi:MAG: hypothetical protein J6O61_19225 [Butyrivibrio sp.]|uniref:hypothetical protein n=1 Tax=Butyrivibrio sp. TaxID=28121 RepID=UPI001B05B34B|nr:hypothetical protein [Butyrivibrio sp.]MBO6242936.1 hypothetical protein [Butyrivibrio sp.]